LLDEAYRRLAWARDDTLKELIAEILNYPGVPARWREPELEALTSSRFFGPAMK
jgi:hypothetical protein